MDLRVEPSGLMNMSNVTGDLKCISKGELGIIAVDRISVQHIACLCLVIALNSHVFMVLLHSLQKNSMVERIIILAM